MFWTKKKKPATEDADKKLFLSALKYEDHRRAWKEAGEMIDRGNELRKQIKEHMLEVTGNKGVEYPVYLTIYDSIYQKPCKESPVGYCATIRNMEEGFTVKHKCLFCSTEI